jgi:NAD dependent epimerase/dehydratase family enzyme
MQGVYIASSPHPVAQVEFMRALRRAVGMPVGLPASTGMVRIGARFLLRTDPELALYGRYVIPKRLVEEGFEFQHLHLPQALQDCLAVHQTAWTHAEDAIDEPAQAD